MAIWICLFIGGVRNRKRGFAWEQREQADNSTTEIEGIVGVQFLMSFFCQQTCSKMKGFQDRFLDVKRCWGSKILPKGICSYLKVLIHNLQEVRVVSLNSVATAFKRSLGCCIFHDCGAIFHSRSFPRKVKNLDEMRPDSLAGHLWAHRCRTSGLFS